jgi:hypothetical protein
MAEHTLKITGTKSKSSGKNLKGTNIESGSLSVIEGDTVIFAVEDSNSQSTVDKVASILSIDAKSTSTITDDQVWETRPLPGNNFKGVTKITGSMRTYDYGINWLDSAGVGNMHDPQITIIPKVRK